MWDLLAIDDVFNVPLYTVLSAAELNARTCTLTHSFLTQEPYPVVPTHSVATCS